MISYVCFDLCLRKFRNFVKFICFTYWNQLEYPNLLCIIGVLYEQIRSFLSGER